MHPPSSAVRLRRSVANSASPLSGKITPSRKLTMSVLPSASLARALARYAALSCNRYHAQHACTAAALARVDVDARMPQHAQCSVADPRAVGAGARGHFVTFASTARSVSRGTNAIAIRAFVLHVGFNAHSRTR